MFAQEETTGNAQVSWVNEHVIKTTWYGRVNASMMRQVLATMEHEFQTRSARYWLCDTSAVTSYATDIRTVSVALLSYVKSRGCEEIISVVDSPGIRLLSLSLSFVVGIRVKLMPTADAAHAYLRETLT